MGKRELGLILAFVIAGVVVWQVTAPKAEGPGFSFSKLLLEARREVAGRRASVEVTTSPAVPIDASIHEIRVTLSGEVTIKGEDREDVAAELRVVSNGYDEAEARKLALETALKVSTFADSVVVGWNFPDPGTQRPVLTLRVPRRLRVQLEGRGTGDVSGVASVTLARSSGELTLSAIRGLVKGEYRGRDLTIDGAEALDITTGGGEAVIGGVRGDIRLTARGGEVRLEDTRGSLTITGSEARVRVDGASGTLRAEMVEGDLELSDLAGAVEIDARDSPVTVGWARPAAAKIQVREGHLELVLPKDAGAYSLDVRATGGELHVPDALRKTTDGQDATVTSTGRTGAVPVFVRGTGAAIRIQ